MRTDVAIIGAGPVGLTLALLLARHGARATVIERQPNPYPLPRAVHFDGEAMRIFQAAGVANAMAGATLVGKGMLFKDGDGRVLVDWSREQRIGETGWYESYRCHQPGVEAVLRDALPGAGIDLVEGVAVTGWKQDAGGVNLTLEDGRQLHAAYAVGCDGANSPTRAAIGTALEDLGFNENWMVVDLILKRPRDDLGDYSVQFCDPDRPATYVRGVGARRRWEIRLNPGEAVDEAAIWSLLDRWIGPQDATLERSAIYTFRAAMAERWRSGRIFLAGDAAHQMPPFMGQGMCCGLRDAGNLGWKLASAVAGDDQVLETYESERAPHLRAFVDLSVNLGRLINQTAADGGVPEGRMKSIWPALGPGLGVRDDIVGRLAPQVFVDGERADDVAGPGCYVLTRGHSYGGLPKVLDDTGWLEARRLEAVVVRPDGYVLDAVPGRVKGRQTSLSG